MSSYSIVVENKDYEVDGSTKTYELSDMVW